jgi:ribosomal subunit interface protein
MAIEVTARHMDASEALLSYARGKAEWIMAEFPRVEHVHVILDQAKRRQITHVVLQAKNHLRTEAEEEAENMRASIDNAFEKIETQLRRQRDKVQNHKTVMKHVEESRQKGEPLT